MTETTATRSWAPKVELVVLAFSLAVLAGGWAVLTDDPPGRLLLATGALLFGAAGLFGTLARPRLVADATGLTVRGWAGRRHWAWAEVNVRLVRTRRLGRDSAAVEVDAEHAEHPALVVLGWLDLGADPMDVAEELLSLRT